MNWCNLDCRLEHLAAHILNTAKHRHGIEAAAGKQAWQVRMAQALEAMMHCCHVAYHKGVAMCRFEAAWLDYISLHDIDFKDSLSCVCKGNSEFLPELVQMASCLAAKPSWWG